MNQREEYNNQFEENNTAKNVVSNIDLSKDLDTNLAFLLNSKTNKKELIAAVDFIKQSFNAKYPQQIERVFIRKLNPTKADFYKQVINFVEQTIPNTCLKCHNGYTPLSQDPNDGDVDVECIKCRIPAHSKCYKTQDIDVNQGIVYMCQGCMQNLGKEKPDDDAVEKEEKEVNVEAESPADTESDDSSEDEQKESPWEKVDRKKNRKKKSKGEQSKPKEDKNKTLGNRKMKKKEEVCPLLIDGNCPHGGAGKECEYTHKRRCYRYINFGTKEMHRGGCKFGDECRFLHPTLCKNSVGLNTCLNENCQYAHLKNTHMKKPYEEKNNSNSYRKPNMRGNSSPYGSFRRNEQVQFLPTDYSSTNRNKFFNPGDNGWNRGSASQSEYHPTDHRTQSYNQSSRGWNNTNNQDGLLRQNQVFLEQAMERMQREILCQVPKQVEELFRVIQTREMYKASFPQVPMQVPMQTK